MAMDTGAGQAIAATAAASVGAGGPPKKGSNFQSHRGLQAGVDMSAIPAMADGMRARMAGGREGVPERLAAHYTRCLSTSFA